MTCYWCFVVSCLFVFGDVRFEKWPNKLFIKIGSSQLTQKWYSHIYMYVCLCVCASVRALFNAIMYERIPELLPVWNQICVLQRASVGLMNLHSPKSVRAINSQGEFTFQSIPPLPSPRLMLKARCSIRLSVSVCAHALLILFIRFICMSLTSWMFAFCKTLCLLSM